MENSSEDLTAQAAAAMLADAEGSRSTLANRLVLPPFLLLFLGLGVAAQIATAAMVWLAPWGFIATIAGAVLYAGVALLQVRRFRRANGVTLGGFTSRVVGGTATEATMSYLFGLAGALWAGFAGVWWLVPVCAAAGGLGFAVSGARWVRLYRADPAGRSRGESTLLIVSLGALAAAALVLLFLLNR